MQLRDAIAAAGMTPPHRIVEGKWMRFPGAGKSHANRAGWCRLITPTLAIFGDWSIGLSSVWQDSTHRDDAESQRLLKEARARERQFALEQSRKAHLTEAKASKMLDAAVHNTHPYLIRKGFKYTLGLVLRNQLLVPMYAVEDYSRLLSIQTIAPDGTKLFLPGGRTKGAIYRLGNEKPERVALCEGFATGLSVQAAMKLLPWRFAVIVCFSANNLLAVSRNYPTACVCADNDESAVGQRTAEQTGLRWVMPPTIATDFNDMHQSAGLIHVVEALRKSFTEGEASATGRNDAALVG